MIRNALFCAAIACALIATPAAAQSVTDRMNNPNTVGNMGLANSVAVPLVSAASATGLGTIRANTNGYQNHFITITTTGSPTYVVTLIGCYESTCAASNQTQNIVSSGSTTTTPLVLAGGGFYPWITANVNTLSGGTITVTYTGSVLATARSDLDGRGLSGNSDRASYWTSLSPTIPTSAGSLVAVEADGTNKIRLRYIKVCVGVGALQTTAGQRQLLLFRTTAASSGGATVVPGVMDTSGVVADAAFAGVLRAGAITTTPASAALANAVGWSGTFALTTAATSATPQCSEKYFDTGQIKTPSDPVAVANGFGIADITGGAGGAGVYNIDLGWTVEAN